MEAVDKAGYYRKRSKETPKARKAKGTKITRLPTEERNHQEEERGKARKLYGHVQEREITRTNEREADIFIACLLGVPFILVVLVVFIFISKPMILMCIIWVIGMLLAMAFGR